LLLFLVPGLNDFDNLVSGLAEKSTTYCCRWNPNSIPQKLQACTNFWCH